MTAVVVLVWCMAAIVCASVAVIIAMDNRRRLK